MIWKLPSSAAALITCSSLLAPATAQEETVEEKAPAETIQVVKPSGVYLDLAEQGGDLTALLMGGGTKPKPFYELVDKLEALADSDSDKVLFDLTGTFGLNFAQVAEVDRCLAKLRKAGKKCYAYLENAGSAQYAIASGCDQIIMADLGALDLPSVALSVTFLKDAFDLLGVQTDVVRCGDFKGAVEPYTLSTMSRHLHDHYRAMVEKINDDVVMRIGRGRNLSLHEVRRLQSKRIFTAQQAAEAGLVDLLVPWKGARDALRIALRSEDFELHDAIGKAKRKPINIMAMLSQMFNPRKEKDVEDETLVVLHLSGGIVDGAKAVPGSIVSGPTVETIRSLKDNEKVVGVVVRINSPGGSATASEAILLALRDLSAAKPVVVSMGRVAASGGYYITCIGRPILAEAATITGSIGVFGMKMNFGALMRRVGVREEFVALDESAKMNGLSVGWTDAEKDRLQGFVDSIYDVFIGHVSRSRGMSKSEVLELAGGRVWSGAQALQNGLVDRIGGLEEALAMVAKDAGIEGDYEVTHAPRPKDFFETVMAEMMSAEALLDARTRALASRLNLDRVLRLVTDALFSDRPTRVWAMMPEALVVR